jgi:hypothetical protein
MPYKEIYVRPDLFLEHNGIQVFHSYGEMEYNEPLLYHYSLDPLQDDDDERSLEFDIRDLSTWKDIVALGFIAQEENIADMIREAIDKGEITKNGVQQMGSDTIGTMSLEEIVSELNLEKYLINKQEKTFLTGEDVIVAYSKDDVFAAMKELAIDLTK